MNRQWTGFGAPQDKFGALVSWTTIVSFREDIPSSLKARAYSSLAKGWLDLAHGKSLTSPDIDRLYNAGRIANEVVSLGLISDAALIVAEEIEFAGFRPHGDDKHPVGSTERLGELTDLWKALDARNTELAEKKLKRDVKLSKDPMGYFCAAKDCGITVTKKSTLRKCGGQCPQALKPAYCSKDCYRAVRLLSHTQGNDTHLSSRIANVISRSADRTPQSRVLFRPTVRTRPPFRGYRSPRRIRVVRSFNQAQSGPSV